MARRSIFEMCGTINDPDGTFSADLAAFLLRYDGSIGVMRLTPTSAELTGINLSKQLVAALVVAGIETVAQLTALNEQQLLNISGVSWTTYRIIVRRLHHSAKLGLARSTPFHNSLECLDLSSGLYQHLRTCGQGQFRTIQDFTRIDMITMIWLTRKSLAIELRDQLIEMGHDFAPLASGHTVQDVLGSYSARLEQLGLPSDTLLSDLTRERLTNLSGLNTTEPFNVLILELRYIGIDLGGPLAEAKLTSQPPDN